MPSKWKSIRSLLCIPLPKDFVLRYIHNKMKAFKSFGNRILLKKNAVFIVLAVLGLLFMLPWLGKGIPILFDQVRLEKHLMKAGSWAGAVFLFLQLGATVLGIPGVVLTIAGGALFGFFWGSLLSWFGSTLGAIGAFWVARSLFHRWAMRRFGHRPALTKLHSAIGNHPLRFVLMMRFAPINPFNILNFLFGLTKIHVWPYSLGTGLGIIPGVLAYTWLGETGQQAIQGKGLGALMIACLLLMLLSGFPLVLRRAHSS
jgi:uncharacterized membrane protein YdjX (TVP38/TMEM64 family)